MPSSRPGGLVPAAYPAVPIVDGGTRTRHGRAQLDVRIAEGQVGLYVAGVEGFVCAAMEFDVLVRHRLIRQTGGLEGLGAVHIRPDMDNQAVPNRVEPPRPGIELGRDVLASPA